MSSEVPDRDRSHATPIDLGSSSDEEEETSTAAAAASSASAQRNHKRTRQRSSSVDANKRVRTSSHQNAPAAASASAEAAVDGAAEGPLPQPSPSPASFNKLYNPLLQEVLLFMDLPSSAHFAAVSRATKRAFDETDVVKGRRVLSQHPTLLHDPRLAVWRSQHGLRLLGQTSKGDPTTRKVTPMELEHSLEAGAAGAAGAAAGAVGAGASASAAAVGAGAGVACACSKGYTPSRPALLRHLTALAADNRPTLLELFASRRLDLECFDSCSAAGLRDLLHPAVETLVRSGWLSQRTLWRLHMSPTHIQEPVGLDIHTTLLQCLLSTFMLGEPVVTRMAAIFLPLTMACIETMKFAQYKCWIAWLSYHLQIGAHLLQHQPPLPRFTLHRLEQHVEALGELQTLRKSKCDCRCDCSVGSFHSLRCACPHIPDCKARLAQRHAAAKAALAPQFIVLPPDWNHD